MTRTLALLATIVLVGPAATAATPQTARTLYASAQAREATLRSAEKAGRPAPTLAKYRSVVVAYEAVARRFPATGYADNALWQAALVSLDALDRFGNERERRTARRLLQALVNGYPSSSLLPKARAALRRLTAAPRPAPPPSAKPAATKAAASADARKPAAAPPPPSEPTPAASTAAGPDPRPLELRQIRRTQNGDGVRVTIEIEGEVDFRSERVDNPPRVLFDLPGTRPGETILEGTLSYPDGIVRYIRVGRQPNDVTRVVLDLSGAARYSSFTLYDPYRIVVDCEAERPAPMPSVRIGEEPLAPPVPDPGPPPPAATATPSTSTPGRTGASAPMALPPKLASPPAVRTVLPARRHRQPYAALPFAAGWHADSIRPPLASRRLGPFWVLGPLPWAAGESAAVDLVRNASPAPPPPPPAVAPPKPTPLTNSGKATATASDKPSPPSPAGTAVPAAPPLAPAPLAGGFSLARQLGLGVSRVVIDPGHGGRDPGALGLGITEATVVLDVALRLEKLLKAAGVEVVLTRRTDEYMPLEERTRLANAAQGDLFLSIHANASRNKNAQGVETYVLNFASNPEAEAVAARENAASVGNMSNLAGIVRAITLNNKLDESRGLAASMQSQLVKKLKITSGRAQGVKQAPFVVLIGASMPSVLVEISFITHRQEGRLLKTAPYRQRIAEALFEGIRGYQRSLKRAEATGGR